MVVALVGALFSAPPNASGSEGGAQWHDLDQRVRPPGASDPMLAYDEARHEFVLFGGFGRESLGTWVRRGDDWISLDPPVEPTSRYGATMVYDSVRAEIVLFGGWAATGNGNRTSNETWIWNGETWRLTTPATSPAPRAFAAGAFDRVRGELVLFGGITGDGTGNSEIFGDTWAWNGSEWRELDPAVSPPPHRSAGTAFDAARGEIVMFGGSRTVPPNPCELREPFSNSCVVNLPSDPTEERPSSLMADTWVWDGTTWSQRSPDRFPGARTGPAVAYDPARNVTVLFGGVNAAGSLTDTWVWDGSEWNEAGPPDHPSHRFGVAMAGDPDSGRVVLFGGHQVTTFARDTWGWDGANWTILDHPPTPEPRYDAVSVYDAVRSEVLLFGGDGHRRHGDTWIYDDAWQRRDPATSPLPRSGAVATYDQQHEEVVLFGGHAGEEFGDTWVWNGTTWRDVSPATSPPRRRQAAMAYDAARNEAVLFGGTDVKSLSECPIACDSVPEFDDTWTWDGSAWSEEQPQQSPPPLGGATMTFDPERGEVVLFGGLDGDNNFSGETWTWDGDTWTHEQPEIKPTPRAHAAMTYDPIVQRVVLFSGLLQGGGRPDVWLWDGLTWTEVVPPPGPSSRLGATLTFHPELGGSLLFGGNGPNDDTWLLRLGSSDPTPTPTAIELTVEGKGSNRTLSARLTDADSDATGIADRTIDFYGDGEHLGSAITDKNGIATLNAPPRYRGGKNEFEARFEGDDYYLGSSDEASS